MALSIVIVVVGFFAKVAEAVFDGGYRAVDFHVDVGCLHFRGVEFEQSQLCVDAFVGIEDNHVGLEVGHRDRVAFGVGKLNKVNDLVNISLGVLREALTLNFT